MIAICSYFKVGKYEKKNAIFDLWNYILVRFTYEMTLTDSKLMEEFLTEIFAV